MGYTLIELLVVIAVAGILTSAIGAFLISNIMSFNTADNQIRAQQQAETAMNTMIKLMMGQSNIITVKDGTGSTVTDSEVLNDISEITFTDGSISLLIVYDSENKELKYGTGTDADLIKATSIEQLQFDPVETSFESCNSLNIIVKSKKKDSEVILKNTILFRN